MCVCAADSAGWCVCAHKSLTYTIPHKSLTYTILRARSLTDGRGEMALPSETSARTDCEHRLPSWRLVRKTGSYDAGIGGVSLGDGSIAPTRASQESGPNK